MRIKKKKIDTADKCTAQHHKDQHKEQTYSKKKDSNAKANTVKISKDKAFLVVFSFLLNYILTRMNDPKTEQKLQNDKEIKAQKAVKKNSISILMI